MNELINEFAKQAEDIYANQTAGDYTWHGFLAKFVRSATDQGLIQVLES